MMKWIDKSRLSRIEAVNLIRETLTEDSPDRFWVSSDQDGPQTQIMNILLPVPESEVYYEVTMLTAQLKAARMVAYSMGQLPGERLAITPTLLDRIGILAEEIFQLDTESENGIALEIVLNVDGLTHAIIDDILGQFLDGGEVPLVPRKINAIDMAKRLAHAREEKMQEQFPI